MRRGTEEKGAVVALSAKSSLSLDRSTMADFTENGRGFRRYFDMLVHEVREYVRMLSQFFRRILGLRVKEDVKDQDADICECESQTSLSSSGSDFSFFLTRDSRENVDLKSECKSGEKGNNHKLKTYVDIPPCANNDPSNSLDVNGPESMQSFADDILDGTNVSIRVNFDKPELEARAGHEQSEFSDEIMKVDDICSHSTGNIAVNASLAPFDSDSIPEWDWRTLPDEHPRDVLTNYFEMVEKPKFVRKSKDGNKYSGSPNVSNASPKHRSDKYKKKNASLNDQQSEGNTGNVRIDKTPSPKKSDVSLTSPRSSPSNRRPDTPIPTMFSESPSEELVEDDSLNLKGESESDSDLSLSDSESEGVGYDSNNDHCHQLQSPKKCIRQKLKSRPKFVHTPPPFRFRPEVRTKDKYTHTLETYSTLSSCKILRCQNGRFPYTDRSPSKLVKTLKGWSRAVLAQPENAESLDPHFDLSCLYNEPNHVFLYDAPSAFERAAYRMDDHIVPEQGKRRNQTSPSEKVKPKVKRRGIPNQHLNKQTKGHEYMAGMYDGDEEGAVGGEAEWMDEVLVDYQEEEVPPPPPPPPPEEEEREESPRVDFRHFEGVPVEVVQKKKGEDEIEMQYNVTPKKKNKNKKKNPKNQNKDNKDAEEIKSMFLMGGDPGRGRPRYKFA